MNTKKLILLIVAIVFLPSLIFVTFKTIASSAYRDTYEAEIQREIYQMERGGKNTEYEKKRKKYLKKRLETMKTIGITSIQFTTKIKRGEPTNSLSSVSYKQGKIYLFIRIENRRGYYFTHIWYQDGIEKSRKRLKVRGSTWRMWTSVKLKKKHIGKWKGIIIDDNDKILATKYFTVTN